MCDSRNDDYLSSGWVNSTLMGKESDVDIVVTRSLMPLAPPHLRLVYVEEAKEGAGQAAGRLLLLSPFESSVPLRLEDALYWSVSFAPEAVVTGERGGIYFYWLCNPLFFAFVATRGAALRVPKDAHPTWVATLTRLEHEARERRAEWREAAKALLTLLLVDAARLASVAATETLDASPLLARVFDVVEARFRETLSLSDVADALHLTPAHLTTLVRRATGRTVNAWITERRMAEARRLLLQTDLYVADVAATSGYTDPAYFTRQFRRRHSASPLRYRQQHKAA